MKQTIYIILLFTTLQTVISTNYTFEITLNNSKISGNLTDFPIYINLSDMPEEFHNNVRSDGGDIKVFKIDNSTELPREIVFYIDSTNTGELYFKANLSNISDNIFYIVIGSNQTDYEVNDSYGTQNVWKGEYKGVWHFYTNINLTSNDSTSNNNDGSNTNAVASIGKLGGGVNVTTGNGKIDFGTGNSLNVNSSTGASFQFWVKRIGDSLSGTYSGFITRLDASVANGYQIYSLNSDNGLGYYEGSTFASTYTFTDTNWHYINVIDNTTHITFFVDGAPYGPSQIGTTTGTGSATSHQLIGYNNLNGLNGSMDEIRISSSAFSNNWILSEYNNMNEPNSFYSIQFLQNSNNCIITLYYTISMQICDFIQCTPIIVTRNIINQGIPNSKLICTNIGCNFEGSTCGTWI